MRLQLIYSILSNIDFSKSSLGRSPISGSSLHRISNIVNFKKAVAIIHPLPFFASEIEQLSETEIYTTTQDHIDTSPGDASVLMGSAMYLINAAEALHRALPDIIPIQDDLTISFKMPDPLNLSDIVDSISPLEKAISQVVLHEKIGGTIKIKSWETGSFWFDLFLGTQAAVFLVAGISWSAAVVYKKIQEGKMFEEYARSLNIKNESLDDLLENQKKATKLLIEQESRSLYDEHFGTETSGDIIERLKFAISTFADLIQKGAEIHPSLQAPEDVSNLFPNFKSLENIISHIKQLQPPEQ